MRRRKSRFPPGIRSLVGTTTARTSPPRTILRKFNERQAEFAKEREKLNKLTEGYNSQHFRTNKHLPLPPPPFPTPRKQSPPRLPKKVFNKLKRLRHVEKIIVVDGFTVNKHDIVRINAFALALQKNLPKSDEWFQNSYREHSHKDDCYNVRLGYYIPDVSNIRFKYVVEVDGTIHNTTKVKKQDAKKNEYFKQHGYKVIHVTAYSEQHFSRALFILQTIRNGSTLSQLEIDEFMASGQVACLQQPPLFGP